MIPAENNGQPGRGFSLDVQGNTAFLQVFNYEKSGAATFHTAVGQLDNSASMTVPLLRFKGGRSFGGPAQDAVEDGNAGQVTVKFTDGLNGTVQFPGESEQPIARFLINQKLPFWWTQASGNPPVGKRGGMVFHWHATAADGSRQTWTSTLEGDADGNLKLSATPGIYPGGFSWAGFYHYLNCRMETSTQVIDCTPGDPPEIELPASALPDIARVRFRVLGRDVVGVVQPLSNPRQRWTLNGWTQGSYSCKEPCMNSSQGTARIYIARELRPGDCITGGCSGYDRVVIQPTSGAWMIEEENTGKPGRGIFLDVQDDTIIVQTSDYLSNGEPTFHLGTGSLNPTATSTSDTTAATPLILNEGGRYFGGPAQSGKEVATAGPVSLGFSRYIPGAVSEITDFGYGSIALPSETRKVMRRLNMDGDNSTMNYFLGEYFFSWYTREENVSPYVRLSRVDGLFVTNEDGTVQCYRARPTTLRCALLPSNNINQPWTGSADINIRPFDRGPEEGDLILRTRDRHGNWLGLGAVNLPGLVIP
ncbi:hypothetical protein SDC9_51767 [bioreactor metagenome]|uniref:Uncharacterized protein n=1 Tax=bioreactor metagenome TaxID=1076179 RepID=A0A644WPA0_9ZZZZ